MRKAFAAAALVAVLMVSSSAHAGARTETKSYTGGTEGTVILCEGNYNVGGACFDLLPEDVGTTVTISIVDDYFNPAGALFAFKNANGEFIAPDVMCETKTATVPAGAIRLVVGTYAAANATPLGCLSPGTATTGTITAAFSG